MVTYNVRVVVMVTYYVRVVVMVTSNVTVAKAFLPPPYMADDVTCKRLLFKNYLLSIKKEAAGYDVNRNNENQ